MSALPKITVITPSYNQASFIVHTINSVLDQEYPSLEYMVIDGGSTDGTVEILQAFEDPRLTWVSERDRGQAHAINKGLAKATGEVLCYLNSDDTLEVGALHRVGSYFSAHPEAQLVTGKCRIIDARGVETRRAITLYKNLWLRLRSYRLLLVLNYISQPATFWRRDLLASVGTFDESLRYTLDYDYWLRAGRRCRLQVIDRYLAAFRVHPDSKGGSAAQAQFDSELAVARRYAGSGPLLRLHRLHTLLVLTVYQRLLGHAHS